MTLEFRTEHEELKLRSDEKNRLSLKEYNTQEAIKILEHAGIEKDNPYYNKYLGLTMANVHNARRFGVYNEQIQQMFAKTLENKELTIEKYFEISKQFAKEAASDQYNVADGNIYKSDVTFLYEEVKSLLNDSIHSGMKMREEADTSFPDIFYRDGKLESRLFVDIPIEILENSSMHSIKQIINEYDDFINFDNEKNQFIIDNQSIGPQKFFNNKIKLLEKFNIDTFDVYDSELFEIIRNADFQKLKRLKKTRGIAGNKTNNSLISSLDDKFVFYETCKYLKDKDINKENVAKVFNLLKDNFFKKSEIVSQESEKFTLGYIDTIMFSISPYDLATQSTFRAWKSCMHMYGIHSDSVASSIGLGSIVAYGFDSANPQEMVSRLLIHPYDKDDGEDVAYRTNDRIYGKENLAFRKTVNMFVKEILNKGKDGLYTLRDGIYNDNQSHSGCGNKFNIINFNDGDVVDLNGYVTNDIPYLSNIDFSTASDVILPRVYYNFSMNSVIFPKSMKKLDLSGRSRLSMCNMDLSNIEEFIWPNDFEILERVKLPRYIKTLDFSKSGPSKIDGMNFSNIDELILHKYTNIFTNSKLPKNMKTLDLSGCTEPFDISGTDCSNLDNLILPSHIGKIKGTKFPKVVDLSRVQCLTIDSLRDADFSRTEQIILPNYIRSLEWMEPEHNFKVIDLSLIDTSFDFSNANLSNVDIVLPTKKIDLTIKGATFSGKFDLRNCKSLSVYGADFTNTEEFYLPENLKVFSNVKLPKNLKEFDLSKYNNINISGSDFSSIDSLILPTNIESVENTLFPKVVDLSKNNSSLENGDFTNTEHLILSPKCRYLNKIKISEKLQILDMSHIENADISNSDLSSLKQFFAPKQISSITGTTFPEITDLTNCSYGCNFSEANFSKTKQLKLPSYFRNLKELKLPKDLEVLDLSACTNINWTDANLDNIKNIKLSKDYDLSRLPEGLYEKSEVVRRAISDINPNFHKEYLREKTKDRHYNENKSWRSIKCNYKILQRKLKNICH